MQDKENVKKFIELMREADLEPRSYSGRAMYGRYCVGVVVEDLNALLDRLLQVAGNLHTEAMEQMSENVEAGNPDEIVEQEFSIVDLRLCCRRIRQDSMGLDTIYYWPDLEWPKDVPDGD